MSKHTYKATTHGVDIFQDGVYRHTLSGDCDTEANWIKLAKKWVREREPIVLVKCWNVEEVVGRELAYFDEDGQQFGAERHEKELEKAYKAATRGDIGCRCMVAKHSRDLVYCYGLTLSHDKLAETVARLAELLIENEQTWGNFWYAAEIEYMPYEQELCFHMWDVSAVNLRKNWKRLMKRIGA